MVEILPNNFPGLRRAVLLLTPRDGPMRGTLIMKKLIRSIATGAFLAEEGGWTNQVFRSREFPDSSQAARAKDTLQLEDVELYYSFDEEVSEWDFTLPLR